MHTKMLTIGTGTIDTCMSGQCQGIVHLRPKQKIKKVYLYWVDTLGINPHGCSKTPLRGGTEEKNN